MKVLCVDDNPMAGVLLDFMLKERGHDVITVQDGAAALAACEREMPDMCILDWMMPDMDGLQVGCAIRKLKGGSDAYVVMLSAKQDQESIERAYHLGVDDFLSKPVVLTELNARLKTAERLIALRNECVDRGKELSERCAEIDRLREAA